MHEITSRFKTPLSLYDHSLRKRDVELSVPTIEESVETIIALEKLCQGRHFMVRGNTFMRIYSILFIGFKVNRMNDYEGRQILLCTNGRGYILSRMRKACVRAASGRCREYSRRNETLVRSSKRFLACSYRNRSSCKRWKRLERMMQRGQR